MWNEKRKVSHLVKKEAPSNDAILKDRAYAFFTDIFLISIITRAVLLTYSNFIRTFFFQMEYTAQRSIQSKIIETNLLSFCVVFWGYFLLSYYLSEGKTPGKIIFHLKVQHPHSHNEQLTLKECFMRTLGYFLTLPSFFTLLSIAYIRKDRKGLPDLLSNTFVINTIEEKIIESLEDETSVAKVTTLFPEDPISKDIDKKAS
ncbi:RDD family protein [Halobacteriovorax sp. HLS]|uniref:RDD family protein n=1 Tax=Halobacteriovorax sp. HLS TaxID=2234000 RepID=UPI000FDA00EB|nr:RDD family protein [Halobacteriovorax sp. HLS]